jgi:uncharacterized protein
MYLKNAFSGLTSFQKLLFFFFLLVAGFAFSTIASIILIFPVFGSQTLNLLSSMNNITDPSVVKAMKIMQITGQAGMFILPAFLLAYLCSTQPSSFLGLRIKLPAIQALLIITLIFISLPFINWTTELNQSMRLPGGLAGIEKWMQSSEENAGTIMDAFMKDTSVSALIVNILMIAILPAIGEELVFRGVIQKLLSEWTQSNHIGVIVTSFAFAAIHLQFYGFLPRFLLGLGFGYIYVWTKNLWLPILAHFVNNILSVIVEFASRKGWTGVKADEFGRTDSIILIFFSFILVAILLAYLNNHSRLKHNQLQD